MKKSEEIKLKIEALEKEYQKARAEESEELIWDDEAHYHKGDETIGFFNLTKARVILKESHNGKQLLIKHGAYGNYLAKMNPQRNRIFVEHQTNEKHKDINEANILNFVMSYPGNWYVVNE